MTDLTATWPGSSEATIVENNDLAAAIVLPGEGEPLRAFGDEITFHLGGAQTGGRYTVCSDVTPPGGGPPPHYHTQEDEWFIPLEGRVEFFLDGVWQEVPLQSVVFIPRGVVHTFRNIGDTPSKMLIHTSPAGFDIFFERCAAEFAKDGPPDMERIIAISAEHGIFYITD